MSEELNSKVVIKNLCVPKFSKKQITYKLLKDSKIDLGLEERSLDELVLNPTSKHMLQYFSTFCSLTLKEFDTNNRKVDFILSPHQRIGFSKFGAGILELIKFGDTYFIQAGSPFHFECKIQDLEQLEKIMGAFKYKKCSNTDVNTWNWKME